MASYRTVSRSADGVNIFYGRDEGIAGYGGEYTTNGPRRMLEVTIPDMTKVSAIATPLILDDDTWLPKGARIDIVSVYTLTAVTGSSSTLDIGLVRSDRSTELDFNGLVAAIPLTQMATAGQTVDSTQGSTYAGALIGTSLANNGVFVANWNTAAFTAGAIRFTVQYVFPTV